MKSRILEKNRKIKSEALENFTSKETVLVLFEPMKNFYGSDDQYITRFSSAIKQLFYADPKGKWASIAIDEINILKTELNECLDKHPFICYLLFCAYKRSENKRESVLWLEEMKNNFAGIQADTLIYNYPLAEKLMGFYKAFGHQEEAIFLVGIMLNLVASFKNEFSLEEKKLNLKIRIYNLKSSEIVCDEQFKEIKELLTQIKRYLKRDTSVLPFCFEQYKEIGELYLAMNDHRKALEFFLIGFGCVRRLDFPQASQVASLIANNEELKTLLSTKNMFSKNPKNRYRHANIKFGVFLSLLHKEDWVETFFIELSADLRLFRKSDEFLFDFLFPFFLSRGGIENLSDEIQNKFTVFFMGMVSFSKVLDKYDQKTFCFMLIDLLMAQYHIKQSFSITLVAKHLDLILAIEDKCNELEKIKLYSFLLLAHAVDQSLLVSTKGVDDLTVNPTFSVDTASVDDDFQEMIMLENSEDSNIHSEETEFDLYANNILKAAKSDNLYWHEADESLIEAVGNGFFDAAIAFFRVKNVKLANEFFLRAFACYLTVDHPGKRIANMGDIKFFYQESEDLKYYLSTKHDLILALENNIPNFLAAIFYLVTAVGLRHFDLEDFPLANVSDIDSLKEFALSKFLFLYTEKKIGKEEAFEYLKTAIAFYECNLPDSVELVYLYDKRIASYGDYEDEDMTAIIEQAIYYAELMEDGGDKVDMLFRLGLKKVQVEFPLENTSFDANKDDFFRCVFSALPSLDLYYQYKFFLTVAKCYSESESDDRYTKEMHLNIFRHFIDKLILDDLFNETIKHQFKDLFLSFDKIEGDFLNDSIQSLIEGNQPLSDKDCDLLDIFSALFEKEDMDFYQHALDQDSDVGSQYFCMYVKIYLCVHLIDNAKRYLDDILSMEKNSNNNPETRTPFMAISNFFNNNSFQKEKNEAITYFKTSTRLLLALLQAENLEAVYNVLNTEQDFVASSSRLSSFKEGLEMVCPALLGFSMDV